jgi:Ferritin-like
MDTLLEIFFLPPMAVARVGSSPTPADSYQWNERGLLHDVPATVIEPAISLKVLFDGSVTPELPTEIVFRDDDDHGPIRPVAPFFELWAKLQKSETDEITEVPLTIDLLERFGAGVGDLFYEINAANRKVERRTGDASHSFVAREVIRGNDHIARELEAFSPHTSGQEPLVLQDKPIPFGLFQVLRPVSEIVAIEDCKVDRGILRVRFTPPKGLVYGPPTAMTGPSQEVPPGIYEAPATQWGRIHEMVPPERRILNPKTSWSTYIMMNGSHEDPQPQDGYDGATVGNHQSWGCVDDTSDGLIQATLVVGDQLYRAVARFFVGPPDFAPDRRPIYSIADDLADRELGLLNLTTRDRASTTEVLDMFHRAFEAASLTNLDATRARALQENRNRLARRLGGEGRDLPKTRDESMMAGDTPYVDKTPILAPQAPSRYTDGTRHAQLPYTETVASVHGPLKNEAVFLDFIQRRGDFIKKIVRPPFGTVTQLPQKPPADANDNFRDPRVFRDQLHDMRMPPYMRDANLQPLSLGRRQYNELMDFVRLPPAPDAADESVDADARRRIFPRNLTARAAQASRHVVGNPASIRLEKGVGNCFPGLEFDVRNLDRRFFPGLVFHFVQPPRDEYLLPSATRHQEGAHLIYADWFLDPMLPEESPEPWVQDLLMKYRLSPGGSFMGGRWYLDWIEQDGHRLSTRDPSGNYYDGYTVWRLVRGIQPNKRLTIGIIDRDGDDPKPAMEFTGYRRNYVNEAGVLDEAFRPGEFTETMCNPWSHDFRDCGCHYWATNHPDVVTRYSEPQENDVPRDPVLTSTYVNWNRDRSRAPNMPAFSTPARNRVYELDHYQINTAWEKMPFVVEGQEIGTTYQPSRLSAHEPYCDAAEMIGKLETELAPLELSLALQYLYALFTVRDPSEVTEAEHRCWPTLRADLKAARQFVLMIAVSEMTHLRWVNQILWELSRHGAGPDGWSYRPIVVPAAEMHIAGKMVKAVLEPLTPERLDEFIYIERPAGPLTGAYGRCVTTLGEMCHHKPELKYAYELALRIDGEGVDHFERFTTIKRNLESYGHRGDAYPYLRQVRMGDPNDARIQDALALFDRVRACVAEAYGAEAVAVTPDDYAEVESRIKFARETMLQFQKLAEDLAKDHKGIPLISDQDDQGGAT